MIWIDAFVTDASTANSNCIKILLASGLSKFPSRLSGSPPDCFILHNWISVSFILADLLSAKALWSLETCV